MEEVPADLIKEINGLVVASGGMKEQPLAGHEAEPGELEVVPHGEVELDVEEVEPVGDEEEEPGKQEEEFDDDLEDIVCAQGNLREWVLVVLL